MSVRYVILVDTNIPDYQRFVNHANGKTTGIVYSSQTTRNSLMSSLSTFDLIERLCISSENLEPF